MFFGLMNSPAIFYIIINKLLRNLINIGQIVSLIDNMLVGTESEEEHSKLVKEVLIRMEVNDLYMNLEKYKWKVREIGFLGVVMRPDKIKIEEEK